MFSILLSVVLFISATVHYRYWSQFTRFMEMGVSLLLVIAIQVEMGQFQPALFVFPVVWGIRISKVHRDLTEG